MPIYRLYSLQDGHIEHAPRLIEAETDHSAIQQAKQYLDGADLELWQGERRVMVLASKT